MFISQRDLRPEQASIEVAENIPILKGFVKGIRHANGGIKFISDLIEEGDLIITAYWMRMRNDLLFRLWETGDYSLFLQLLGMENQVTNVGITEEEQLRKAEQTKILQQGQSLLLGAIKNPAQTQDLLYFMRWQEGISLALSWNHPPDHITTHTGRLAYYMQERQRLDINMQHIDVQGHIVQMQVRARHVGRVLDELNKDPVKNHEKIERYNSAKKELSNVITTLNEIDGRWNISLVKSEEMHAKVNSLSIKMAATLDEEDKNLAKDNQMIVESLTIQERELNRSQTIISNAYQQYKAATQEIDRNIQKGIILARDEACEPLIKISDEVERAALANVRQEQKDSLSGARQKINLAIVRIKHADDYRTILSCIDSCRDELARVKSYLPQASWQAIENDILALERISKEIPPSFIEHRHDTNLFVGNFNAEWQPKPSAPPEDKAMESSQSANQQPSYTNARFFTPAEDIPIASAPPQEVNDKIISRQQEMKGAYNKLRNNGGASSNAVESVVEKIHLIVNKLIKEEGIDPEVNKLAEETNDIIKNIKTYPSYDQVPEDLMQMLHDKAMALAEVDERMEKIQGELALLQQNYDKNSENSSSHRP